MKQSYAILAGLAVILGVVAYLVLQRPGESSRPAADGKYLLTYDSSTIDKIEIRSQQGHVVMEKQAGKWMVVEPIHSMADEVAVTAAVAKGTSIGVSSLISSNPEKQTVFQIDTTATLVKVYEKGNERAAFRVGKPSSSFIETYVRTEGSNDVFLANEVLGHIFVKTTQDWRDKTIFKTLKENIRNVGFTYGDTTFTLALQDTNWIVDGFAASQENVATFVTALSNLVTDGFVDSAVTPLPKPVCTIEVAGVQLRFYFTKDFSAYLVQTSDSPQWFELQSWRASQILKRRRDFQPAS